ncbi:hypothetical protein [Nocardia sp. NPDC005825]|uniref:hypothetical protein n=1 Tax=unclassified Nocardia TaxID=2637762 RepID=UPI003401A3DA
MGIILAITLSALLLVALALRVTDNPPEPKLTVADIQARLAAEQSRTQLHVSTSRGWTR